MGVKLKIFTLGLGLSVFAQSVGIPGPTTFVILTIKVYFYLAVTYYYKISCRSQSDKHVVIKVKK